MKVADFVNEMKSTSAVFGRETGVYVTFEGDQAYTDGKRINLPSMGLNNNLTPHQVRAMRGYVDHEAGHVRHTDMALGKEFISRCEYNGKQDLRSLHNCIEDVWMESKVIDCYSGSKKNLSAKAEVSSTYALDLYDKQPDGPDSLQNWGAGVAGLATKWQTEFYNGPKCKEYRSEFTDEMTKWAKKWHEEALKCKNTQETIDLAMAIYKMFEDHSEEEMADMDPEDFDPQSGNPMESVGEPDPNFDKDKAAKGEGKSQGHGSDKGEGEGTEAEMLPEDYMPTPAEGVAQALQAGDGAGGIGKMDGSLKGGYRVYSTQNDVVYKRGGDQSKGEGYLHKIVNSTDGTAHHAVIANISGPINVMSGKLRRALLAKKRVDRDCGREMGRLDSKRLVSAYQGASNVFYQRVDRKEEDTSITILGDLSGSMGGRKAVVARDCIVALSECLGSSSMPFKVTGFCNKRSGGGGYGDGQGSYHRYEALDSVVFKSYTDSLKLSRPSIAQFDEAVGGNNSDYDFIQQELHELRKRPEQRKVLFVLSDGHPVCRSDADYMEHVRHCREAIKQARKDGIECVGIGICDEAVKEIYDDYVVVHDVNDLSAKVFNKLTNLLVGG